MDRKRHFERKRVLITGGLGFIGSHLARRLAEWGAHVLIVDAMLPNTGGNWFNLEGIRSDVQVQIADLREHSVVNEMVGGQDFLFNLAGQTSHVESMLAPETDLAINAGIQLAIVEACRKFNPSIKIVYASTRQVYGQARSLPVNEEHPIVPMDFNGVSKRAGEMYHLVGHRVYGLHATSLRLTNTYGPHLRCKDARQTFIGWWVRCLLEGKPIPVYGAGRQLRDLNYVEDVVDAFLRIAIHPQAPGQAYNLGGETPICLLELARLMIAVHGGGSYEIIPFPENRRRIDIGDYHGDYAKIQAAVNWQPQIALRSGLERTLAFYAQHKAHYWEANDAAFP
ncbi:MAG: NAD-dependent epimerase/dehydratase family protein [Chloroflexota bacterium]